MLPILSNGMMLASLAALSVLLPTQTTAAMCATQSQPNPIANQYPSSTTGTVNGTIAVLPIGYSLARSIIPSKYAILNHSYRSLLPNFPADMFPALLQTDHDHDVRNSQVETPDFSRASIYFPFVDRLGDGYTAMTYAPYAIISADQPIAIAGANSFGIRVIPGSFDPPCDAYAAANGTNSGAQTYFNAYRGAMSKKDDARVLGSRFTSLTNGESLPYPLSYFQNVTNQPLFSRNPLICDQFITLFNSSVSLAPFEPTPVRGTVSVVQPLFAKTTTFSDVYGFRVDAASIENNLRTCSSLRGYNGTGSGD